ncbi:hypothetical protein VTO42DRAFT_7328 [Malbranchea cinnamomea]
MISEVLWAKTSLVLRALPAITLWAVAAYFGILFISPFIIAIILRVAFLATRSPPGGTPVPGMKTVPPFNLERDRDEITRRKLDSNLPILKRIAAESISYASGLTAVLLQIAHPGVGKGVGRHSNFSTRLLERTQNTGIFINVMVFGTDAEKNAFRNFVTMAHQYVNDKRTKNTYDALDPELQLWVAATMYVTMLKSYETVFGPLSEEERDQVYQEFSIFGTALQVPLSMWPENRAAFQQYWNQEVAKLRVPDEAVRVSRDLFHPRYSKVPAQLALILFFKRPLDIAVATEELPEHVRHGFRLKSTLWTRWQYAVLTAFNKLTYRLYPQWVRAWHKDYYLWLMRQRFAGNGMTRNGKVIPLQTLEQA